MMMLEAFVFITIPLLAWMIIIYNLLVRDKIRVQMAWSDIEIQLKHRHNLIPKLVDIAKQYAAFESSTLATITELLTRSEESKLVDEIDATETKLDAEIKKLLLLAEAYPDLITNQSFLDLQHNLNTIEEYIERARRDYNYAVRNLNTRITAFPDLLFAKFFRFQPANYFQKDQHKK